MELVSTAAHPRIPPCVLAAFAASACASRLGQRTDVVMKSIRISLVSSMAIVASFALGLVAKQAFDNSEPMKTVSST